MIFILCIFIFLSEYQKVTNKTLPENRRKATELPTDIFRR